MKQVQMMPAVDHIAVVSKELSTKSRSLLDGWLGKEYVREIKPFKMTEFDKLIALDSAVLPSPTEH